MRVRPTATLFRPALCFQMFDRLLRVIRQVIDRTNAREKLSEVAVWAGRAKGHCLTRVIHSRDDMRTTPE
jgi:hypothetical protein